MSKKPFEHIEDKIKAAAENHQPPYQENAWEKMNALLDKETDNKRPVPFWLIAALIALLAGGGYLYLNSNAEKNKNTLVAKEEKNRETNKDVITINEGAETKEKTELLPEKPGITKPAIASTSEKNKSSDQTNATPSGRQQEKDITAMLVQPKEENKKVNSYAYKLSNKGKVKIQSTGAVISGSDEDADQKKNIIPAHNTTPDNEETIAADKKNKLNHQPVNGTVTISDEPVAKNTTGSLEKKTEEKTVTAIESKPAEVKKAKTVVSKFYLLASVGAEAASVKFLSFGNSKLAATYGLGVGYQLSKKLSIQTGFYAGQKKYIAGHNDYHPKAGSYWNEPYINIKKVDAVCMVYEIPISFRYNFSPKKSGNYFITAGISSYIMKKEDYNYDYMHYDNLYTGSKRIYTGNKKLFSALTFSAGLDKHLSGDLSWYAGPTFSIPVAGVGEGSVKLFSAGIVAGIRFQPSLKK